MRLRRRTKGIGEDIDLDLVPIMNMFLVLIPFLLLSASFFQIKAINTSIPVMANSDGGLSEETTKKSIKVTVIVELEKTQILLSAMSDDLRYDDLVKIDSSIKVENSDKYPMDKLAIKLKEIKDTYPDSDTLILVPDENILYATIIQTMDTARNANDIVMFPNVVLSGKVG